MTSPSQSEIEKAREEIRLEIDCREERLRELEFLEKGDDPLDFKFCHAVSLSIQSTSLADQHTDQIVTSKAKDSYGTAAVRSQHGEADESFGKSGDTTREASIGDNLILFDGDNTLYKDENIKGHAGNSNAAVSEILNQTGGNAKANSSANSAFFRPYARRNRSKSNRDGARLGSVDVLRGRNHVSRDLKGSSEANRKDQKLLSISQLKSSNMISEMLQMNDTDSPYNMESVAMSTAEIPTNVHVGFTELSSDKKSHGDLLECIKDREKYQDAKSRCTGFKAEETTELANCASHISDAQKMTQKPGIASQSDVLVIPKEINYWHPSSTTTGLDIQPPKNYRGRSSNLVGAKYIKQDKELILVTAEVRNIVTEEPLETNIDPELVDTSSAVVVDDRTDCGIDNCPFIKVEEDLALHNKVVAFDSLKTTELRENKQLQVKKNVDYVIDCTSNPIYDTSAVQISTTSPLDDVSETFPSDQVIMDKYVPDNAYDKKFTNKMDEDSILNEAKIIQAKRLRIAELSKRNPPLKNCTKSHRDFLLEEVTWLANDFMQERVRKVSAAAQLIRHSAQSFHLKHQDQMPIRKLKFVAYALSKAVMDFWHICETLDTPDSLEPHILQKSLVLKSYALRFLRYNNSTGPSINAEDQVTLSDVSDFDAQETSGESCITEDDIFYAVPPGTMHYYRTSVESYVSQCEKNGSMEIEDDSSVHEVNEVTMKASQENIYYEDEGETSLQYLPRTVDWRKVSFFSHRKQKSLKRTYSSGSYELGADLAYGIHAPGSQKSVLVVKRSTATQNLVSVPMKRMRTASRQRALGSSSGVGAVNMSVINKTDASSEDTKSFQDDQGSLHGGSQMQRSLEVESPMDFVTKHKKRKNDKNMGNHSRRRLESNNLGSNGVEGLFGHHKPKRLKLSKQTYDTLLDNGGLLSGSMPLPAASQMSNMSSANEYKRLVAYSERLKKTRGIKFSIPMSGFGNAWTSFEDQALIVLVHDLGPNWDLVSDAINSTIQVKYIFREPKECKERHKLLMDQSAGDVADLDDDSGSFQPYPSTMPGIPKGSARQLFQQLHGPMEEDLVKSHFEKIIMIEQRKYHSRKQCHSHEQKHNAPLHNSHVISISQVTSSGGFLTPLDLIDAITSSLNALAPSYQSPQTNGFSNQSCGLPVLPLGMTIGNSLSSPSGPTSHWKGRYRVSTSSLPVDDQQRVQQSNSFLSGRNIQQSTTSVPGPQPVHDRRGAYTLQGGDGMGLVNGINSRGKPMSRPGFQGHGSSALLDSAAMQTNSMHNQNRPGQSRDYHRQKLVPEMQMPDAQANSHYIAPSSGLEGSYTGLTRHSSSQSYSAHPQPTSQNLLCQSRDLMNSHLKGPALAIGSQNPARLVKERRLKQQIVHQQQQYSA